jgi:hypothetical protein
VEGTTAQRDDDLLGLVEWHASGWRVRQFEIEGGGDTRTYLCYAFHIAT